MKTIFTSIIISGFFSALILTSCESHEQKADDAFENYKNEKMKLNDSDIIANALVQESNKTEFVKKNENVDDWTKFKIATEKKIRLNENKIKEIKVIPNENSKLLSKVERLEKNNNDLRSQMDQYNEEAKIKLEKFKESINQDVNDINVELKAITANDKK
ncbi:MAG: hypothetical protein AABZ32_00010 [Bacteroidota bacterium]